jgi:crossover junction endodeoxyribonuclease RusA
MPDTMTAAEAWAVVLPWPHKDLSPNARVHWREKRRRHRSYRHTCSWECVDQGIRKIDAQVIKATIIFSPPDSRRRDIDNMIASVKAAIDAVAEAIGVDDSRWQIEPRRGVPVKGGNVRIVLEAA